MLPFLSGSWDNADIPELPSTDLLPNQAEQTITTRDGLTPRFRRTPGRRHDPTPDNTGQHVGQGTTDQKIPVSFAGLTSPHGVREPPRKRAKRCEPMGSRSGYSPRSQSWPIIPYKEEVGGSSPSVPTIFCVACPSWGRYRLITRTPSTGFGDLSGRRRFKPCREWLLWCCRESRASGTLFPERLDVPVEEVLDGWTTQCGLATGGWGTP